MPSLARTISPATAAIPRGRTTTITCSRLRLATPRASNELALRQPGFEARREQPPERDTDVEALEALRDDALGADVGSERLLDERRELVAGCRVAATQDQL